MTDATLAAPLSMSECHSNGARECARSMRPRGSGAFPRSDPWIEVLYVP